MHNEQAYTGNKTVACNKFQYEMPSTHVCKHVWFNEITTLQYATYTDCNM